MKLIMADIGPTGFQNPKYFHTVDFAFPVKVVHSLSNSAAIMTLLNMTGSIMVNIIQLMTFHEVNTKIDQPMEHDIHRLIRCVLTNYFRYTMKLIMADIGPTGVCGEQSLRY
jgi:hypothetical protein